MKALRAAEGPRYETLSALCELARLGDKRLQGACAALAH